MRATGPSGADFGILKERCNLAQDYRIARCAAKRLFGKGDKVNRVEGRCQPLQAHGGDGPVSITPGPSEKVQLPGHAFVENGAQLRQQGRIVACCRSQSRIKGSVVEKHRIGGVISAELRRGLTSGETW